VRCANCRFVYRHSRPADCDKSTEYDDYHGAVRAGEYGRDGPLASLWTINRKRIDWISSLHTGGRLLDIGCGCGYFLHHARESGFAVRGLEISHRAALTAKREQGCEVITGDLEKIADIGGPYDVITMWHVLEHLEDPVAALQKAKESLAGDGSIFIEVPNLNSAKFRLAGAQRRWTGGNHPRYHLSFFTLRTIKRALTLSDLSLYRFSRMVYGPSRLFLALPLKKVLNFAGFGSFLTLCARRDPISPFPLTDG
jgi:2-polyprenyl-3-methyl-5-hydroxy-6-metoxy-1,4-benzoquinol methylase